MAKRNKGKQAKDFARAFKDIAEIVEKYSERIKVFTEGQYNKLKNRFYGKYIAVIGPRMAGKTTFINILQDHTYEVDPMNYTPTQEIKKQSNFVIDFNIPISEETDITNIKLKIRKPKDVGGHKEYIEEGLWREVCEDANFIFYILDASRYENEEKMKTRFKDDLEWIGENNQLFAPGFGIVLFLNKMDKISPEFEKRQSWADKNIPIISSQVQKSLDGFSNHFLLAAPISMVSKKRRANAISQALLKTAE